MEECYKTLSTIYDIVKADREPHTYLCTPHEIILRQTQDWAVIQKNLDILLTQNLVTIKRLDKLTVSITMAGIAKAKSLKNNFVNDNFSFIQEDKIVPVSNQKL
jgi:hypothetical protein